MRDLAVFSRQFATLIASGMPMLRSLYTLEDQTEDPKIKEAAVEPAQGRRGGQLGRGGDGAAADDLRPALPLDGASRRGLRPARDGAGDGRLPAREARRAAPPDPLGGDVPGARLRLRDHRDDRRSSPSSSRSSSASSRSSPRDVPGEGAELPLHVADHGRDLRRDHRLLVHRLAGAAPRSPSASSSGRRPSAAAISGTR